MSAYKRIPKEFAERIISIVARDLGGRGVAKVCTPYDWQTAAEALCGAQNAAVVSGFYVPAASAPETDGPGGAVMLARAFLKSGRQAQIWTDSLCIDAIKACAGAAGFPPELVMPAPRDLEGSSADALIFTERLGRASDGCYYNCRKENIDKWTEPLDRLADLARLKGITTAGIGDGGNETGMGCFREKLACLLPGYSECLCVVKTDSALAVDVSNWGAYALTAALSLLWGTWCGPEAGEELDMLKALQAAGAVDGISKNPELTVDGFDIDVQNDVILSLREAWKDFNSQSEESGKYI